MTTIGIIGAFDAEVEKLIEIFDLQKHEEKREVYIGNYEDKKLVVARSGIGKVNSAAMTQHLIDCYDPDLIINTGCAGSLSDKVKIMDVVLGTFVTYHDFSPIRVMAMSTPDNGKIETSPSLIKLAEDSIKELDSYNYHLGSIASGDCFVTSAELRDNIRLSTGCLAVDMESASIGHISRQNNIPFISIRTISDFADGQDDFEDIAAYKSSFLVKHMIEKLNSNEN